MAQPLPHEMCPSSQVENVDEEVPANRQISAGRAHGHTPHIHALGTLKHLHGVGDIAIPKEQPAVQVARHQLLFTVQPSGSGLRVGLGGGRGRWSPTPVHCPTFRVGFESWGLWTYLCVSPVKAPSRTMCATQRRSFLRSYENTEQSRPAECTKFGDLTSTSTCRLAVSG